MFTSEPKLFSIGIISIPLETLEKIVINIVQLERTTKTIDSKTKPFHNFRSNTETLVFLIKNLRLA